MTGPSNERKPLSDQYVTIADRDRGDNPLWEDVLPGDRYLCEYADEDDERDVLVRIERRVDATATA